MKMKMDAIPMRNRRRRRDATAAGSREWTGGWGVREREEEARGEMLIRCRDPWVGRSS
jgi:hypothetical protein